MRFFVMPFYPMLFLPQSLSCGVVFPLIRGSDWGANAYFSGEVSLRTVIVKSMSRCVLYSK